MPLGIDHLATVGFIIGDGTRGGKWVRKPIGTAFRVSIRGEIMEHGYLVTAAHVLWDQEAPTVRFRVPGPDGADLEEQPIPQWYEHWDADVAVAPLPDPGPENRHAISMDTQTVDEQELLPQHGADVYYVGLLDPAVLMAERALPMVRSGTVGALYAHMQPDPTKPPYEAHLIDCRSYGGFSGSPCLVQFPFPGPAVPDRPIPERLIPGKGNADPSTLGLMVYATVLLGVLIKHIDDLNIQPASNLGIGIILPVERIWEVLLSEELVAKRKETEQKRPKGPHYKVEDLSAVGDQPPYRAKDFARDLKKATKKLEKPQR